MFAFYIVRAGFEFLFNVGAVLIRITDYFAYGI